MYKVWIKLNGRLYGILARSKCPHSATKLVLEKFKTAKFVEVISLGY